MTRLKSGWFRLKLERRALAALLVIGSAWAVIVLAASSPSTTARTRAPATPPLAGVPSNDIALGSSSAPMTLTVFADLTDMRFRRFDHTVLPTLVRRYVRPGRLQIRLRTLSGSADAAWAAKLAHAASLQGQLWNFVQVFESSYTGALDPDTVRGMLGHVPGLNVAASLADAHQPRVAAAVARAESLAPQPRPDKPVFLLNGGRSVQLTVSGVRTGAFLAAIADGWSRASSV